MLFHINQLKPKSLYLLHDQRRLCNNEHPELSNLWFSGKQKDRFATLKGLLASQPSKLLAQKFVPIPLTPENRTVSNQELRIISPGGSQIAVPVLDCQDVTGFNAAAGTDIQNTVSLFNEDFKPVPELTVSQVAQPQLSTVNVSVPQSGIKVNMIPVFTNILPVTKSAPVSVSAKPNSNEKRKTRSMNTKSKSVSEPISGEKVVYQTSTCTEGDLVELGPGETYTATPISGNYINKAHVRSLNFGPQAEESQVGNFRKICPKPRTTPTTPQVIILQSVVPPAAVSGGCVKRTEIKEICPKVVVKPSSKPVRTDSDIGAADDSETNDVAILKTTRRSAKLRKVKTTKSYIEKEVDDIVVDSPSNSPDRKERVIKTSDSNSTNKSKSKNKIPGEKLKVRVPVCKKASNKNPVVIHSTLFTMNKQLKDGLSDVSNTMDDLPLSRLKQKIKSSDDTEATDNEEVCADRVYDSELPSEVNDNVEESADKEYESKLPEIPCTPKRPAIEISSDDFTPSKQEMLESVGLTPKKSLLEMTTPVKTPTSFSTSLGRPNSGRPTTPLTRGKLKGFETAFTSPISERSNRITPRKITPAKKLFASPMKGSSKGLSVSSKPKDVAKQVDVIIERLHKNNPESALSRKLQETKTLDDLMGFKTEAVAQQKSIEKVTGKTNKIVKGTQKPKSKTAKKDQSTKSRSNKEKQSRSKAVYEKSRMETISVKSDSVQTVTKIVSDDIILDKKSTYLDIEPKETEVVEQDTDAPISEERVKGDVEDVKQDMVELESSVNFLVDLMGNDNESVEPGENLETFNNETEAGNIDNVVNGSVNANEPELTLSQVNETEKLEAELPVVVGRSDISTPLVGTDYSCSQTDTDINIQTGDTDSAKVKNKHRKHHKHRHRSGEGEHSKHRHRSGEGEHSKHRHRSKHKKHRQRENGEEKEDESLNKSKHRHRSKHRHKSKHRDSNTSGEHGNKENYGENRQKDDGVKVITESTDHKVDVTSEPVNGPNNPVTSVKQEDNIEVTQGSKHVREGRHRDRSSGSHKHRSRDHSKRKKADKRKREEDTEDRNEKEVGSF